MTQVVPTLPSGETPQPGTGGTGFSAPHLSKYNHISSYIIYILRDLVFSCTVDERVCIRAFKMSKIPISPRLSNLLTKCLKHPTPPVFTTWFNHHKKLSPYVTSIYVSLPSLPCYRINDNCIYCKLNHLLSIPKLIGIC